MMLRRYTYRVYRWVEMHVTVLGVDDDDAWEKASRQAEATPATDYPKAGEYEMELIRDEAVTDDTDPFL